MTTLPKVPTAAAQQYAKAYAAHYAERNLPLAFRLYRQVMELYSGDPEEDFARVQIQNIVNSTIPTQELLMAQMELVTAHFERDGRSVKVAPPKVAARPA